MPWLCTDWDIKWDAIEATGVWVAAILALYIGVRADGLARDLAKFQRTQATARAKSVGITMTFEFANAAHYMLRAGADLERTDIDESDRFDHAAFNLDRIDLSMTRAFLPETGSFPGDLGRLVAAGHATAEGLRKLIKTPDGGFVRIAEGTAVPGAGAALLANIRGKQQVVLDGYKALCLFTGIPYEDIPGIVERQRAA